MRILYLTPGCFDKGGISRYSRYQINALRTLVGVDNVFVFSVLGPSDEDFEDAFDVMYFAGGTNRLQLLAYLTKLCSTAIFNRPDIIISAHINLSGVAKVLSKLTGAKSVLNIYGAEAWSTVTRDAAWGLRRSDHVISDCHYTARYLEERGIRAKNSIAVVWDCVDLQRFFPAPPASSTLERYGIPDPRSGINILTLGRMGSDTAHYKGYERLLEVFSRIADRLANVRLIYAGRGEMVEILRRQAEALGLSQRVFFTGMVHEDDLPDVYRSAHLFSLVTNKGEGVGEGIPLTPLEAAACGIPLIVGNHDGSQEAVIEGVDGYIIDTYDLEAHARAIVTLGTDEDLRTRMGQAARKRAELEFAFPKFLKKHEELLTRWFSYEVGTGILQNEVAQTVTYL
jgi:phosphatidylinositol alpha-1,6-mannosyltransferase